MIFTWETWQRKLLLMLLKQKVEELLFLISYSNFYFYILLTILRLFFISTGIITEADLKKYSVVIREVVKFPLPNDLVLNTMSAPGGGPIVSMILNIMSGERCFDFLY